MKRAIGFVAVLFVLVPGFATANETEHEEEEEKKNEFAIFAGALTNIDSEKTGPSVGVEYLRFLSPRIAIGAMAEYGDAGEREGLFAVPITFTAKEKFKLIFAPGYVIEEEEHEAEGEHGGDEHGESTTETVRTRSFVARFGFGYEIEISSRVKLFPTVYFDVLKGSKEGVVFHLVYGVTVGFPF